MVELQTQLNGTRAGAVATRKFYEDQVQGTLPPPQRAEAKAEIDHFIGDVESEGSEGDRLRKELDDAKSAVGVDDADMQQASALRAQYDDVLRRLHDLDVRVRQRLSAGDREKAEQIESILDRARAVQTKVNAFNGRIDHMLDEQLKEITTAVDDEKLKVMAYRKTLGGYTDESADVGGGIVAENFKAVTQRFYNVVVRADVGIIDVAWALKESSTHESTKLLAERKRELKLLDDQFKEVTKISHDRRALKRCGVVALLVSMPLSALGAPNGLPGPDGAKELDAIQNTNRPLRRGQQGLSRHARARGAAGVHHQAQAADVEVSVAARLRGEGTRSSGASRRSSCLKTF